MKCDLSTRFIGLAGGISLSIPSSAVPKAERMLRLQGKSLRGSTVQVLGVAYKEDVPDMRESHAPRVNRLLVKEGCEVVCHYPYVPCTEVQLQDQGMYEAKRSVRLDPLPGTRLEMVESAGPVVQTAEAVLDRGKATLYINDAFRKAWML